MKFRKARYGRQIPYLQPIIAYPIGRLLPPFKPITQLLLRGLLQRIGDLMRIYLSAERLSATVTT